MDKATERLGRLEQSILEIQNTIKELKDDLALVRDTCFSVSQTIQWQFPQEAEKYPIKYQMDDLMMMISKLMDKLKA